MRIMGYCKLYYTFCKLYLKWIVEGALQTSICQELEQQVRRFSVQQQNSTSPLGAERSTEA